MLKLFVLLLAFSSLANALAALPAAAADLVPQTGHTGLVRDIAFSPDGKLLASVGGDRFLRIWDLRSRKLLARLPGATEALRCVAFNNDGKLLAAGGYDHVVRLWDVTSGQIIRTFTAHNASIRALAFAPGTDVLVSADSEGALRSWQVQTKTLIRTWKSDSGIGAMSCSPDGTMLATAAEWSSKPVVTLWEIETGERVGSLTHSAGSIRSPIFSSDGTRLAAVGDHCVIIWQLKGLVEERTIPEDAGPLYAAAFSADGQRIYVTGKNGTVRIFRLADGEKLAAWRNRNAVPAALQRGPTTLLLGPGPDGQMDPLDPETQEALSASHALAKDGKLLLLTPEFGVTDLGSTTNVEAAMAAKDYGMCLKVSPDGTLVAAGCGDTIRVWSARSGRELTTLRGVSDVPRSVDLDDSGRWLATGHNDGRVRVWDLQSARQARVLDGHVTAVSALSWVPHTGRLISGSEAGAIEVWDASEGTQIAILAGHQDKILSLKVSPDGRRLVSFGSDGTLRFWDIRAQREYYRANLGIAVREMGRMTISPDSSTLAQVNGQAVELRDLKDGHLRKKIKMLKDAPSLSAVSFSLDGSLIFTGFTANSSNTHANLGVWNARTTQLLQMIDLSCGDIRWLFPNPKDHSLVVVDETGRVINLNTHDWTPSKALGDSKNEFTDAAFAATTGTLARVSSDGYTCLSHPAAGGGGVSLFTGGRDGFSFVDQAGYYLASRSGLDGVALRSGQRALGLDQYDLALNRPDVILAELGSPRISLIRAYQTVRARRLQSGTSPASPSAEGTIGSEPPKVEIVGDPAVRSVLEKTLQIQLRASPGSAPLSRLHVLANGVPIYGVKGRELSADGKQTNIDLEKGFNRLEFFATDVHGVASSRIPLEVRCEAPFAKPDLYLVAVGVSKYRDADLSLDFADKDARDVSGLLQTQEHHYNAIHAQVIENSAATRENIRQMRDLLSKSKVGDEVIVFFAGHGLVDTVAQEYYFGTADIDPLHPSLRGLSYLEIEELLDGIAARRRLLLLDTCHAGVLLPGLNAGTDSSLIASQKMQGAPGGKRDATSATAASEGDTEELLQDLLGDSQRGSGATVFGASTGSRAAYERREWGNGAFTHALMLGMRQAEADLNGDGIVNLSELRDFLMERVPRLTNNYQKAAVRRDNLVTDYPIFVEPMHREPPRR